MAARTMATMQRVKPAEGLLVFYEDNLVDGRAPIEMLQSDAIKQAGAALDYLQTDEEEELRKLHKSDGLPIRSGIMEGIEANHPHPSPLPSRERGLLQSSEEFVFLDSNLPIRLESEDLRISIAPDYYRSRNVDVSRIRDDTCYNLREIGKPPEWALEVASRITHRRDLYEKPDIYARIGVAELWMFDPTGGELYGQALMGFRLAGGEYEPVEIVENEHGLPSGYSEELGLRLCALEWSKREEILRLQPNMERVLAANFQRWQLLFQNVETGEYVINMRALRDEYSRVEAERDAAERRAESEREARETAESRAESAESERAAAESRAESAEARAEELEAELRRLRGE